MLWQDGSYTTGGPFPSWGWIGAGGDTYIIKGSIADGVSYRVGWNNKSTYCDYSNNPVGWCWGITGSQNSGQPPPPSGTGSQHTRILGANYANCSDPKARTQLHGGWGAGDILNLSGTSYVDVACLDITDFSACGRATQRVSCDSSQDFAQNGIIFSNTTTHDTVTNVRIHGLATNGIMGPTGDGVVLDHVDILGNASSGWNADNGSTGKGSLMVQHYEISWNGCAEEYPIVDPIPYGDCTDQDNGGYGDGFGTATMDSELPGWQVHFDDGIVSYNTQDGLDALHIAGKGSSMTVTNTRAFSNMGQQIKVGGATATLIGNVIVGNCRAMSKAIPGTPKNYNNRLDLFCRAGDTAVLINVPDAQPAVYQHNIMYSANHVGLEIEYPQAPSPSAAIKFDDNIFVGFPNSDGQLPTPIYSNTNLKMFTNPGSSFSHNTTYHAKSDYKCPATSLHESAGSCSNPHLKDETWHEFGIGDMSPTAATGKASLERETDHSSGDSYVPVTLKSLSVALLATGIWRGFRHVRDRSTKS